MYPLAVAVAGRFLATGAFDAAGDGGGGALCGEINGDRSHFGFAL